MVEDIKEYLCIYIYTHFFGIILSSWGSDYFPRLRCQGRAGIMSIVWWNLRPAICGVDYWFWNQQRGYRFWSCNAVGAEETGNTDLILVRINSGYRYSYRCRLQLFGKFICNHLATHSEFALFVCAPARVNALESQKGLNVKGWMAHFVCSSFLQFAAMSCSWNRDCEAQENASNHLYR